MNHAVNLPFVKSIYFSFVLKVSLFILLLATIACRSSAQKTLPGVEAGPTSASCKLSDEYMDGLSGDAAKEISALPDYRNTTWAMLRDGQFEQLDCLADHARTGKERFAGGSWKLHLLYEGLEQAVPSSQHATEDDWESEIERLQGYVAARPESITAKIALAQAYLNYAWYSRGNGTVDTVSANGRKSFEERTAKAKKILAEASHLPTKCPEWYLAMQGVLQNQSASAEQMRALFEEANKFQPGYFYYHRMMAMYLLPQWTGKTGDAEKFALEIADRTGGEEGDYLYFQIANRLVCSCEDSATFSTPRIVKGFEASEKLYGTSMQALNQIVYLTSRPATLDAVIADSAISRIGEEWDAEKWADHDEFDQVKNWAIATAPNVQKQRKMEAEATANAQTPDGAAYKVSFEKKYRQVVKECMKTQEPSSDKFETTTLIGAGTVEDMKIYWNGPAAMCVYAKLSTYKQKKEKAFPRPPRDAYWIRLDLNASEFAAITSK